MAAKVEKEAEVPHREAPDLERRLAAILAADVEGYSRLMHHDEEATMLTLSARRTVVDNLLTRLLKSGPRGKCSPPTLPTRRVMRQRRGRCFLLGTFRVYRRGPSSGHARFGIRRLCLTLGVAVMNKDRIAGAAKEIKGSIKQTVGKAVGDAKLQSDGTADKVEGKVQNAIGGLKDALKP